jgi:CheY-like chemotaxis protein
MDINVMVVDDNVFIRESMEILFQSKGIQIVAAAGASECLQHLEAGFRGIILMDVMMPHLDGWDTIEEIVKRGLYDGNVIVMLTAKREPDAKMEAIQAYVTDYITKPFNPSELLDMVHYYAGMLGAQAGLVRR